MSRRVRLGISTCPNDTFAFHALLAGEIRAEGVELDVVLLDVQELNERLLAGALDVAKVSFHAALAAADRVVVLPSGAALGFGVGPLVLAAPGAGGPRPGARVLSPGAWTTAHLLWRLFHDGEGEVEHVVFSEIVPRLRRGEADLGVCIHEARFTWERSGLERVEDLGETWERRTGLPLPLGGLVASRALGEDVARRVQAAVRASLERGLADPDACLPTMRAHAQEHDDDVLRAHVDTYVSAWTLELGPEGGAALDALSALGRERGLLPSGAGRLDVLGAGGQGAP